ncbi:cell growth-regulating nucleolar protein-like [Mercenaria mercenaria]|uniref:cell growth-regulating nucleolar protein-like n=1 Tax=Mercenaria mercenaria TaxID=6596 RepID=UPI00234E5F27|nr:cell growth-regulating nucleolar protein-like [Mercenaria mercenaria]
MTVKLFELIKQDNFLSNGFHVKDPNLASQVWDMLMANTENKKQVRSKFGNKNGQVGTDEKEEVGENTENQSGSDEDTEQPAKKKFKTKFNWNDIIVEVLQTKGPEMKTKKLRKKVLAEYLSQGCSEKSEEKLWARFEKKLKKIPEVKVIGDKVKLKNAS